MKKALTLIVLFFTCLAGVHAADTPPSSAKNLESTFPIDELFEEARKPDDKFFMEFVNMLFTLGFVIGLILIVAWFLKRMVNNKLEQANLTNTVKVLERYNLSPKTAIYLVEIHDKTIALAESGEGVTRLAEFPFAVSDIENKKAEIPSEFRKILDG